MQEIKCPHCNSAITAFKKNSNAPIEQPEFPLFLKTCPFCKKHVGQVLNNGRWDL